MTAVQTWEFGRQSPPRNTNTCNASRLHALHLRSAPAQPAAALAAAAATPPSPPPPRHRRRAPTPAVDIDWDFMCDKWRPTASGRWRTARPGARSSTARTCQEAVLALDLIGDGYWSPYFGYGPTTTFASMGVLAPITNLANSVDYSFISGWALHLHPRRPRRRRPRRRRRRRPRRRRPCRPRRPRRRRPRRCSRRRRPAALAPAALAAAAQPAAAALAAAALAATPPLPPPCRPADFRTAQTKTDYSQRLAPRLHRLPRVRLSEPPQLQLYYEFNEFLSVMPQCQNSSTTSGGGNCANKPKDRRRCRRTVCAGTARNRLIVVSVDGYKLVRPTTASTDSCSGGTSSTSRPSSAAGTFGPRPTPQRPRSRREECAAACEVYDGTFGEQFCGLLLKPTTAATPVKCAASSDASRSPKAAPVRLVVQPA